MKPFYRDSLQELRAAIYSVFQRAVRMSSFYPTQPAPELRIEQNEFLGNIHRDPMRGDITGWGESPRSTIPRVIIVSRNLTGSGKY